MNLWSHSEIVWPLQVKFEFFKKAIKIWKKISCLFWRYWVNLKTGGSFFFNFVAFSQCLNFKGGRCNNRVAGICLKICLSNIWMVHDMRITIVNCTYLTAEIHVCIIAWRPISAWKICTSFSATRQFAFVPTTANIKESPTVWCPSVKGTSLH